jgi:hypothetical protein
MRIIIFIVFIMMIIIFINELKNISASFFQINYIKDVADINIKKHCNDIYCEAETGRFNIAKNSYKLLLPNDFYNTKTYYFMILLIIIIFYINTFYNFIKYNNLYLPHNNKNRLTGDGNTYINYVILQFIRYMPYILALSILILIILILVARYAPTETQGYRNYFNINNDDVGKNNSLNIQNIHISIIHIITILPILYGFFYCITNIKISDDSPQSQQKNLIKATANNHKNMCMGYLIITILMTYLLFNIMNILLSFTDNKYPKLDNNRDIIEKNYDFVKNQYKDLLTKEKLLQSCYTVDLTSTAAPYSLDIIGDSIYGITVDISTDNKPDKIKVVFYNKISNKDNEKDYGIDKLKVNYYFKYISPLYPFNKIEKTNYKYKFNYNTNYTTYTDIHNLKDDDNIPIINKYKDSVKFDAYYMIEKIRIGHLKKESDIDKILELLINKTHPIINDNNIFNINCNILLDILIFFSVNEIKYLEKKDKETKNKETKDFEYIQHILLLDLIDYFEKKKGDTKNIANKDALKEGLTEEITKYSSFTKNSNKKITQFFGKDYDILSNSTEIKENFSVDISYGSANKFYEKYFNISNNDNNANDEEYKLGGYIIKNIKTLIYFIIVIIVIAIVLIIFIYIKPAVENDGVSSYSYSGAKTFAYDVLIPLIILIIFVIYIFIFMSFNTNYNLNVIYGLFDSSYKRDLNDMNNLIIPFIKLHTNNNKKYDKNYYDLYIITNVMASFLYSEDNYATEKYKNIYLKNEKADATYSKEETIDYNEFKKYYEEQFTIINNEFEEDFSKIKIESNLKKLYNNINSHIKTDTQLPYTIADIVLKTFDNDIFTEKFKYDNNVTPPADNSNKISNKIVNIILICLELFGDNKDDYKKETYKNFIDNFYFEKDKKSGNIISHKFRFKKSVFDYTYTPAVNSITISGFPIIYIENFEDKKKKIINIINNYMNIISLFQYNYILSEALSTQPTQVTDDIKTKILQDAKDVGYKKGEDYLHKYKNRKLISLISNTKSFEKMSFVLAEATFKYSKYTVEEITDLTPANAKTFTVAHITALTPEAKNALKEVIKRNTLVNNELSAYVKSKLVNPDASTSKNNAVEYVYTDIINSYNINVSNISDNYLENVVKTICYQVDNRDVVMNQEPVGKNKKFPNININKIYAAHDNHVSILHKANQCVTYDFATNYMVNLIILGIIYYIGLDNNKIF